MVRCTSFRWARLGRWRACCACCFAWLHAIKKLHGAHVRQALGPVRDCTCHSLIAFRTVLQLDITPRTGQLDVSQRPYKLGLYEALCRSHGLAASRRVLL